MFRKAIIASAILATTPLVNASELVIASRDSSYGEAMEFVVSEYNKVKPETKVTLVKRPTKGLYESTVLSMREQTGHYDVILMDDTWAPEFLTNQWLAPLSSSVEDTDFVQASFDIGRYPDASGPAYAMPMVGNVAMFAWNRAEFAKHDLSEPTSWTDVLNSAKTISESSDTNGVVFRGVKGNPIVTGFLPVLWGYGADVVDENGRSTLDSKEAVEALETFLAMKQFAPRGVDVYNADEVRDSLQKGTAAMAIEVWPAWVPNLDNADVSNVVGDMEIMAPPAEVGSPAPMLGIWQLAIPSDSNNKQEAEAFLKFATSADIQKALALDYGMPPTRNSIYFDDEVVSKYRWYPQQAKALSTGKARPRIHNWAEVESILGDFLQLAMMGQMSPEQALKQAHTRINRIVKS
ncbi:extracellular solute-binding protein [Vibrio sp. 10N.222.51.C8]|jgi:multiple sugar transport system substrate-binding protein|uniref:extracellular solute-binding protein n=1 Tax=Vibrio TaxID=662 RepID=UPI0009BEF3B6|nr:MULTISPECIES: extracellular solute-binding protein [Vibrio]OQQ09785.1 sugar ABC transporter substrate-binding protein [Vibrio splendidus]PMK26060.1 sugar ABC transporter substrate-binding protein [Vibrio sp. 10N.261.54.C3]PMO03690.1 sugar ABC transporter substrate-binding protein [Vibrio sp. 10N.222.55.F9]PMO07155.1 sugar ABC transporter substrate-binding protein [Vibrio sp. 10N.222.55.C12]PMO15199.1 sugar ABC transporter substrate-binding protein [Vibrio sp. 10N.222.54.F10]